MQLSLSTEYAIHSLFYLALQGNGKPILVSEVARAQNISESYLAKVFQTLSKAGVIKSFRGAKGGYILAKNPSQISLKTIVEAMEGNSPMYVCDDYKRKCYFLGDCAISQVMSEAEQKMYEILDATNLEDLLEKLDYVPQNGEQSKSVPFWGNGADNGKD